MNSNILATLLPVCYCLCSGQFVTVNPDTFRVLFTWQLSFSLKLISTLLFINTFLSSLDRSEQQGNGMRREGNASVPSEDLQTNKQAELQHEVMELWSQQEKEEGGDQLAKPSLAYLAYRLQSSQWFQDCWSNK